MRLIFLSIVTSLFAHALGGCQKTWQPVPDLSSSSASGTPCVPRFTTVREAQRACPQLSTRSGATLGAAKVAVGPRSTTLVQVCRATTLTARFEDGRASPNQIACRPLPKVDWNAATPLSEIYERDYCQLVPAAVVQKPERQYCQRNDPKVMATTGGSCMAMSWYWAMMHVKDERAMALWEQRSLFFPAADEPGPIGPSDVDQFFNVLRAGMTEAINDVQLELERKNNRLFALLRQVEATQKSGDQGRMESLAAQITALRQDKLSFLKLVPVESDPDYHPLKVNGMFPSHGQYPDTRLYRIPDRGDFSEILRGIAALLSRRVNDAGARLEAYPLTGRKTGLFIFHLLGDGNAHAMGLKYTVLPSLGRSYWTFFDPSSGELEIPDDQFVATLLKDFEYKGYTAALGYAFHEVVGLK